MEGEIEHASPSWNSGQLSSGGRANEPGIRRGNERGAVPDRALEKADPCEKDFLALL